MFFPLYCLKRVLTNVCDNQWHPFSPCLRDLEHDGRKGWAVDRWIVLLDHRGTVCHKKKINLHV